MANPRAIRVLSDLVRERRPSMVFLIETICDYDRMMEVKSKIGLDECFIVPRRGHSGGLALFWKSTITVTVLGSSDHYIDCKVQLENETPYRWTGFYGYANRPQRYLSWTLLRDLYALLDLPWVIIGDFNELLSSNEKRGSIPHPLPLINSFREVIEELRLIDLGYIGKQFTWERRRGSEHWVEERLDRAIATESWIARYGAASVYHIAHSSSDHIPIFLKLQKFVPKVRVKSFKFENAWLVENDCARVVQDAWAQYQSIDIQSRLQKCENILIEWSKSKGSDFQSRIRQQKVVLECFKGCHDELAIQRYRDAETELFKLLHQEEIFWKQRAKLFWLQSGDDNTKAFHVFANGRRKKKTFSMLQDGDGRWLEAGKGLEGHVGDYFVELFTGHNTNVDEVTRLLHRRVSESQNMELLQPLSDEEIMAAAFSMHSDKAPGMDGFNPGFYKKFWSVVGVDVITECKVWFNQRRLPQGLNDTNIVLIPKKNQPATVKDLRPISLCKVIYKILAKVLANRLKVVLQDVVSENQSAFIAGRHITDNIIVANEVMHYMKGLRRGKTGYAALKLDIAKAYDRLEWRYVAQVLRSLGFAEAWVDLMMMCISTVRYNVLLGENSIGPIIPSRGLRQGDPLSPYLFILAAEGFSALIRDREEAGVLHGCRVSTNSPVVSHLFFADDSYLFFRATEGESNVVKQILEDYREASGQEVSFAKSSISFSQNVQSSVRRVLCDNLGVEEEQGSERYLGMPIMVGRKKRVIFDFLKHKLQSRIENWGSRCLSRAGKSILLKTVAQALPTYVMSLYLLPLSTCDELQKVMNKFWWGSLRWMRWDRLCDYKSGGGLGFRNLRDFNLAMLAKQGWRLMTNENCLMSRVMRARYFPQSNYLSADIGGNPSMVWRSIWQAKDLLLKGVRVRVGDGSRTDVWSSPWLPTSRDGRITTPKPVDLAPLRVCDLFVEGRREWDIAKVSRIFNAEDRGKILAIPLCLRNIRDEWTWLHDNKGVYTVKSGYKIQHSSLNSDAGAEQNEVWRWLWRIKAPPKMLDLVWRALSNCLPTKVRLAQKGVISDVCCPVCLHEPESILHALSNCEFSKQCWQLAHLDVDLSYAGDVMDWMKASLGRLSMEKRAEFVAICWALWKQRNDLVWRQSRRDSTTVVRSALSSLHSWLNAKEISIVSSTSGSQGDVNNRWSKPSSGWYKYNVDAAVFPSGGAVGLVQRDDTGRFIGGYTRPYPGIMDPTILEMMAIRDALLWLKDRGKDHVVVESDCQVAVNLINQGEMGNSCLFELGRDCKIMLSTLNHVRVEFVHRTANWAAHHLVQASRFNSGLFVWGLTPPDCIIAAITADLH